LSPVAVGRVSLLLLALAVTVTSANGEAKRRFGQADQKAHYHRDRVTDVIHTRVDVTVDIRAGRVTGLTTMDLVLLRPSRSVRLDGANLTIESVSLGELPAAWEQRKQALIVHLPEELPAGRKLTIKVRYATSPRRGMYFVRPDKDHPNRPWQAWTQGEAEDNRFWFASYDFPDDRFTTEIVATVRKPFSAVSNGVLLSTTEAKEGWRTFHWRQGSPHVNYLVTLVVGELDRHVLTGHRVPMAVWVPKKYARDWKRSFEKTADMMTWFEEFVGRPYPWAKYDQVIVEDFLYGGMENTSATTLTSNTIHDERAALDWSSQGLVAHELAHQWFGDLLTCRSWSHLWLNEGFATYSEMLYREARQGKDEFDWDRVESTGWYLHAGYIRRMDEPRFDHPDDLFDGHTYVKGAWILHMLRVRFGDALFRKAVRQYVARHAQGVVETDDLRRAFEEVTGAQLQDFFDQWVHRPGHPKLALSWSWDDKNRALRLKVKQKTKATWKLTLPVHVMGGFGEREWTVALSDKQNEFTLTLPSRPTLVEVDRDAQVLAEIEVERTIAERLVQLRQGKTAHSRRRAAEGLSSAEDGAREEVSQALATSLGDSHEFRIVRAVAASALGSVGGEVARKALMLALRRDASAAVRAAAARALISFDGPDVVTELAGAFAEDRSYKTAAAALTSLIQVDRKKALAWIGRGLKRRSHREVIRAAALQGLADIGGAKALRRLVDWTAWGKPLAARRAAVDALGRVGAEDEKLRVSVRERLVALLADGRFWVRNDAVDALGSVGDPAAIPALERLAKRASTRRIARSVQSALAALRKKMNSGRELGDQLRELEQRINQLEGARP
jgi:aminopeptidase N